LNASVVPLTTGRVWEPRNGLSILPQGGCTHHHRKYSGIAKPESLPQSRHSLYVSCLAFSSTA